MVNEIENVTKIKRSDSENLNLHNQKNCNNKMKLNIYIEKSSALGQQGQWNLAEKTLENALSQNPNALELYIEYAKLAMDRAYWSEADLTQRTNYLSEAIERWKLILDKFPTRAPVDIYKNLGDAFYKQNLYHDAEIILIEGMNRFPEYIPLFISYARVVERRRKKILWKLYIKYFSPFIERIIGKPSSRKIQSKLIPYKYNYLSIIGEKSNNELICGNSIQSYKVFCYLMSIINLNNSEVLWKESYEKLIAVASHKNVTPNESKYSISEIIDLKPIDKILVSGMGWSGSGALLYFFKEFESVCLFDEEEFMFIRGESSLKSLYSRIGNKELFIDEFINFFWLTLISLKKYVNPGELECVRQGLKFVLGEYSHEYAKSVNYFITRIELQLRDNQLNAKEFEIICSEFINLIIKPKLFQSKMNKYVLLNNIIDINNINLIKLIDQYNIFCTFRDPRSQYVAIIEANPHLKENISYINYFISSYRRQRKSFEFNIQNLKEQRSKIHIIQFEEFILSKEYRKNVAEEIGLNLSDYKEYQFFKPWISKKNVFNYKSYFDQRIIERIESELSEYCWDISKLPSNKSSIS